MIIIKRKNGYVIINEDRVFKIFNNQDECSKEKQLLSKEIFFSTIDKDSGYKLDFVEIIHYDTFFYIMDNI